MCECCRIIFRLEISNLKLKMVRAAKRVDRLFRYEVTANQSTGSVITYLSCLHNPQIRSDVKFECDYVRSWRWGVKWIHQMNNPKLMVQGEYIKRWTGIQNGWWASLMWYFPAGIESEKDNTRPTERPERPRFVYLVHLPSSTFFLLGRRCSQ